MIKFNRLIFSGILILISFQKIEAVALLNECVPCPSPKGFISIGPGEKGLYNGNWYHPDSDVQRGQILVGAKPVPSIQWSTPFCSWPTTTKERTWWASNKSLQNMNCQVGTSACPNQFYCPPPAARLKGSNK